MAEKKVQHYVPQNYQRGFSSDGDNIGVFKIDTEEYKPKKGIKKLAQRSYFYTKYLELEDNLSEVEDVFARNRRDIGKNPYVKLTQYQREVLYQDMFLQMVRVPELENSYNEMVNAYAHRVWEHDSNEEVRKRASDFGAKVEYAIIPAMMAVLKNFLVCYDLKAKLLVNKTDRSFITSDNPVVLNDMLFEYDRRYRFGLNSTGLQIYYPLSPTLAVMYYDDKVYKVGFKKQDVVDITDVRNVNMLNLWIMVNATNLLLFDKSITNSYIANLFDYSKRYRLDHKREEHEIKVSPTRSYIIAERLHPTFGFCQTYIKLLDKYKHKELIAR